MISISESIEENITLTKLYANSFPEYSTNNKITFNSKNDYTMTEVLGSGNYGAVIKAASKIAPAYFAVKIIPIKSIVKYILL